MSVTAYRAEDHAGSAGRDATHACDADLCIQIRAAQEAIRLTRLGARAGLVSRLTGLEPECRRARDTFWDIHVPK